MRDLNISRWESLVSEALAPYTSAVSVEVLRPEAERLVRVDVQVGRAPVLMHLKLGLRRFVMERLYPHIPGHRRGLIWMVKGHWEELNGMIGRPPTFYELDGAICIHQPVLKLLVKELNLPMHVEK